MSKTNLEEINRNIYDIKNKDEYDFKIKKGLTREIIEDKLFSYPLHVILLYQR